MKAHFFDPSDLLFINGLLATIKLACKANNIQGGGAILAVPFLTKNALATTLNIYMSAAAHVTAAVESASTTELLIQSCFSNYIQNLSTIFIKRLQTTKR